MPARPCLPIGFVEEGFENLNGLIKVPGMREWQTWSACSGLEERHPCRLDISSEGADRKNLSRQSQYSPIARNIFTQEFRECSEHSAVCFRAKSMGCRGDV